MPDSYDVSVSLNPSQRASLPEYYRAHAQYIPLCITLLLLSGVVALAGPAKITDQSVAPTQPTVGTPLTYEVRLLVEDRHRVTALPVGTDDPHLEIAASAVQTTDAEDGDGVEVTVRFPVRVFSPGDHIFPAVHFRITAPNGSESNLVADAFPLRIVSVLPEDAQDILDIKSVHPWHERNWLLWAFLGSVSLLVIALVWWLFRRRRRELPAPVFPDAPPRPAHVIALEALAELERADWIAQGKFRVFFVHLSEIVREYLEGRYRISAPELTTREVLASLDPIDLEWESRRMLSECLMMSDLVKFARYQPSKPDSHQQLEQIREFIHRTRSRISALTEAAEQTGTQLDSPSSP